MALSSPSETRITSSAAAQPRRKRLLVISYHFPPDGAVGGLRWSGMSKYLARHGWEVHILTAAKQIAPPAPDVCVHYCPAARTINDVYNLVARRVRSSGLVAAAGGPASAPQPETAAAALPRRGVVATLRRNIASLMVFPDFARGWILPAARMARSLLDSIPFDAVVSSGPPHSAHLAAAIACRNRPGLLIVDMRDPWGALTETTVVDAGSASPWMRALTRRLERWVFTRARRIIANTAEYANHVREAYPNQSVAFVSNGVDPERLPGPPDAMFNGLSIAYAGTLYLGRDLSPVVRAMRDFVTTHPEARESLRLRIAGSLDAALEAKFRREVSAANLEPMVETLGRISGTQAMDLINRSHLTLVLAQDQPTQIPAKLYECVAMGVPTLVIAETSSAAAREANRIGAMTCDADDVAAIAALLERLWHDGSRRFAASAPIGYDDIAKRMELLLTDSP